MGRPVPSIMPLCFQLRALRDVCRCLQSMRRIFGRRTTSVWRLSTQGAARETRWISRSQTS